ncbi:MAG: tetratricopeptide repeat protein [Chloroflexi bacterium]|nr:tetratricopeptide repeat protein [Chloroflexota bacterium]
MRTLGVEEYGAALEQARGLYRGGDTALSVDAYLRLIDVLASEADGQSDRDEERAEVLATASEETVDVLRWAGDYQKAIALSERMVARLPDRERALRIGLADLKVEGGQAKEGLRELAELILEEPEDRYARNVEASALLWLGEYEEAHPRLLALCQDDAAPEEERAEAYRHLISLYEVRGQVNEALEAWGEACRFDEGFRAMLPEICRMLVYRRHWDKAALYAERHESMLLKRFYGGLAMAREGQRDAAFDVWRPIVTMGSPKPGDEGCDEYAEAALWMTQGRLALDVLVPLIEAGDVSRRRLVIAGLAWGQTRVINRAKDCLAIALRMEDLERPRRSRPVEGGRILDADSRITYGSVIIDSDVRPLLDGFFMPKPTGA